MDSVKALDYEKVRKIRKNAKRGMISLFRFVFLISVSYIVLFPLFFMISKALTPNLQMFDPDVVWLPKSLTLENFRVVMEVMEYFKALGITLFIMVGSAILQTITCALPAYGMARFKFFERGFLFIIVIITILVPVQAYIIPLFLNFSDFDPLGLVSAFNFISGSKVEINLINTPLVFYLPSLLGVGLRSGVFIFIYRQFFIGLPGELEEAAWIDGAGSIKTFLRVIIPSSGVAILTVCIFSIIWHWNDYYLTVMYFSKDFPLSVRLAEMESSLRIAGYGTGDSVQLYIMAACLLFVLPVLIMYLFLQKKFIESVDRIGIVG